MSSFDATLLVCFTALSLATLVFSMSGRGRESVSVYEWTLLEGEQLEKLMETEKGLVGELENCIGSAQGQVDELRRFTDRFSTQLYAQASDVTNPVHVFLLLKRLAVDWPAAVKNIAKSRIICEFVKTFQGISADFPTPSGLVSFSRAIFRLQDTYSLSVKRVSSGRLVKPNADTTAEMHRNKTIMNADDCFELGKLAYVKEDFYHAVMWFEEAKQRREDQTVDTKTLLDFLSHSLYKVGDVHGALKNINEYLKMDPLDSRALKNKRIYGVAVNKTGKKIEESTFTNTRKLEAYQMTREYKNYEKLCRGEKIQGLPDIPVLSCRYAVHHSSLLLSPAKEEQLSVDPPVIIFHDVVGDRVRQRVRQLATSGFVASKVLPDPLIDISKYDTRSSRTAWLADSDDPLLSTLSRKASALTNLSLESAEDFQVLNYGFGGHYVPHNDYLKPKVVSKQPTGNRIATFLCYLSPVGAGGATVFPNIGVSVEPEEGACVFWYNLLSNGEGDEKVKHASCPVLVGSKWAANKWFRERGQEFLRPCESTMNGEGNWREAMQH